MKRKLLLADIAKLQSELNTKADPNNPDWINARTIGDFELAAMMELAELTDSIPWKWWKKSGIVDKWNTKIEVIDAIHFLVSKLILMGFPAPSQLELIDNPLDLYKSIVVREMIIDCMQDVFSDKPAIIITLISDLCSAFEINEESLSAIYVAKHTLNNIRYENGYAAGTYKKMKENGIEDNAFLEEVVDNYLESSEYSIDDIPKMVSGVMLSHS